MLSSVSIGQSSSVNSDDNSGMFTIIDEDTAIESMTNGISTEDLTNGGAIQDVSIALVSNRTRTIQDILISNRLLSMGYNNGRLQVLPPKMDVSKDEYQAASQ